MNDGRFEREVEAWRLRPDLPALLYSRVLFLLLLQD